MQICNSYRENPMRGLPAALLALFACFIPAGVAADVAHDHLGAPGRGDFFADLFKIYTPRTVCMFYESPVIWTHLISDVFIALAYFSIPFGLVYFARKRRDLEFNWMFICFAVFILACGTTHVMNVIALWAPVYRLDGLVKAITALASIGTAALLRPLIPRALSLPSPMQLRAANEALEREVSERKLAEKALQAMHVELEERVRVRTTELQNSNDRLFEESEARKASEIAHTRLAAIVESSQDAIISKTLDGMITTWNRGAQHLFGYAPEEAIGRSILLIVPPERHDEEPEILSRLKCGERIEHFETERVTKNGQFIQVSLSVSPVMDYDGNITGASKIIRDITQQKRDQTERERMLASEREARSEAERANRTKDEFLATLSHELRTPLNAILGWSRILKQKGSLATEQLHRGLEVIERNTRAQVQLVEDLLDMNRIVSGRLRLDVQTVDLSAVIESAADTVMPAVTAKEIRLQLILDPLAGPVTGDPARLQQVVWNLLTNAVKFTPRMGRVQVFLERVNSHLEITVADTGEGIRPEFLPVIFERFRQIDSGTTRRFGGLGLGLAIVRHLVELHGGSVKAKSAGIGHGSTFIVTLPLRVVKPEASERRAHPRTGTSATEDDVIPRLDGVKVLVVDDEPDARDIVRLMLLESGAQVVSAASASEGLEILHRERPGVLISDIGMPEEDGYTFIRKVRKLSPEFGGDIPAIALTAFARSEDRRMALMSGFQMHVMKPVEPAELITVVASLAGIVG